MALKKIFIDRYVFYPNNLLVSVNLDNAIDQQERVTVRNGLEDLFNVQHRDRSPFRFSRRAAPAVFPGGALRSKASAIAAAAS